MKSKNEVYTKLENALRRAYREKEKVTASEQWQKNVMNHILGLKPLLKSKTTNFELFETLVWRCAPVVGILILILTICTLSLDFVPEYEMAKILINDPVQFTLVQILGV